MFGGTREKLWKQLCRANNQACSTAVISWTRTLFGGWCITEAESTSHCSDTVQGRQMWASKLLLLEDFSAQAEWYTVAKTLILASRMIVSSLMSLIKVSSRQNWHCFHWQMKREEDRIFFLSWKWGILEGNVLCRHCISNLTLRDMPPKHNGLTQHAFIYSYPCSWGQGSAGLAHLCSMWCRWDSLMCFWSVGWFPWPL